MRMAVVIALCAMPLVAMADDQPPPAPSVFETLLKSPDDEVVTAALSEMLDIARVSSRALAPYRAYRDVLLRDDEFIRRNYYTLVEYAASNGEYIELNDEIMEILSAKSPDSGERYRIYRHLSRGKEISGNLSKLLEGRMQSEDAFDRIYACAPSLKCPSLAAKAHVQLLENLKSKNATHRCWAITAIGFSKDSVLANEKALREFLANGDRCNKICAIGALQQIEEGHEEMLIELATSKDDDHCPLYPSYMSEMAETMRSQSLSALGNLQKPSPAAIQALRSVATNEKDPRLQAYAISGLGRLQWKQEKARAVLEEFIRISPHMELRGLAVRQLSGANCRPDVPK